MIRDTVVAALKYNPYLKTMTCAYFDIEATGFSPKYCSLVCASFLDAGTKELTQIFCPDPSQEHIFCLRLLEIMKRYDALITFNGDRYDLPFVLQRMKKHGICNELPLMWNIDLYRWLKKYWTLAREMKSLSQSSVEKVLGIRSIRTDRICGADCVELYKDYLETGCKEAEKLILLHNADDVRQLSRIADELDFLPYHKIAFETGFFLPEYGARIEGCKYEKNRLICTGRGNAGDIPCEIFNEYYHYSYDSDNGTFKLSIEMLDSPFGSFSDLDMLPVNISDFKDLPTYRNGYLVLFRGKEPEYLASLCLIRKMLEELFSRAVPSLNRGNDR